MQPTIAVLPPEVIDQIAAGEVIERPASVVKELVDNAIDAGARTIAVEVDAGGRALIRVVDDGIGMTPSDALLAFERHATSKLRAFDDVWSLATLGFRGEALPAIASVSRLTLTTRRKEALAATRIVMDAGRLGPITEVGAPVGTTVEVEDLLCNVPARLKFLKSDATEASHTTDLVAKLAMAYPELHFKLRHNGRIALDAPPDRDVFARAQALLGRRTAARLVSAFGEESGVRVTCVLGAPELSQTTARGVQLFVRRRPVRDRGLLHALAVGYGELVPRGRYPLAIVLIDPPDGRVDVNVHPQKAEVRFSDPSAVYAAVRHVVQTAVARAPWRDESAGSMMMTAVPTVAPPALPTDPLLAGLVAQAGSDEHHDGPHRGGVVRNAGFATTSSHLYAAQLRHARDRDKAVEPTTTQLRFGGSAARSWAYDIKQRVRQSRAAEITAVPSQVTELPRRSSSIAVGTVPPPPLVASDLVSQRVGSLRYLSQLDLTYLVCEGDRELVLIDQHVAHECVELARLRRRAAEADPTTCFLSTQPMLFPTVLDLAADRARLATDHAAVLARLGFEVTSVAVTTVALGAAPSGVRDADPSHLFTEILESWIARAPSTDEARLDCALAVIACRTALRVGDHITPSEAEALIAAMDDVADGDRPGSGTCLSNPRRAIVRLTTADIARRLGGRQ